MKKMITQQFIRTTIFLLAIIGIVSTANAYDFEVDGIYYNIINDNEVAVTNNEVYYYECTGDVSIPETVTYNGTTYSVTSIGNNAFYNCSGLTSIDIPNSVTSISSWAFEGCASLTSIDIPNSVTSISSWAFSGCTSLTDISVPNSVTSIGEEAFNGTAWYNNQPDGLVYAGLVAYRYKGTMPANTHITLREGTLGITDHAFENCSSMTSITIPNSVTSIGYHVFYNCSGLTSVDIPNSVTSIVGWAFEDCSSLTSVDIPNSVTSIGSGAFKGCTSLTTIDIPNSVTTMGYGVFSGTVWYNNQPDGLVYAGLVAYKYKGTMPANTHITLREGTLGIADYAFEDCSSLTSIIIPNSVATIGNGAFNGCSSLTNINIPNSVTSIGNYAFSYCSGLTSVDIPNSVATIGNEAFKGCSSLTTINIPNSVTSIGNYAFSYCSGLTSVTIGNSVTLIDFLAFDGCHAIETVTCKATTPPSSNDNFLFNTNVYIHAPLYVPIGSERAYMAHPYWGRFINIIGVGMEDEVLATGISLNKPQINLLVGGASQLVATVLSDSTSNKTVTWASNNPSVAAVDNDGLVAALAPGNATITAMTTDGSNLSASCLVVVSEDMSDYDDYLSLDNASAFRGDTIVIPVMMTNESSIIAFQTDIFLPDGLELLQEDGEYIIDPSSRMTRTHSIMSNEVSSGAIRVICYSSNYKPFTGNSGDDLFYLTVKVADDAEGDYTIQLKNTLLTNTDFVDLAAPDVAGTVHVQAYLLGDANNSGTVSVTDVVVTAQYVLELDPHPFVFEAADVNFDNNITVSDVSRIAWMVLNPTLNAPLRAPALWNNGDRMSAEGITLAAGETRMVSILLDNEMDYNAFQFDLTFPEGLTASNFQLTDRSNNHAFEVNTLQNGSIRALCYSPVMTCINGHQGALLTFDVTATGTVNGDITVDGIELVTPNCNSVQLDGFTIVVNNATGMNETSIVKTVARMEYYNLAGQRLDRPESGVILVVTSYTDGTRVTSRLIKR